MPMDKNVLFDKLTKLTEELKVKLHSHPQYAHLPVNKYVIGKNAQLTQAETLVCPAARVIMHTHLTYVLPNLPEGNANLSLPEDEFSFASTKEPHTAKFFLKGVELDFTEEVPIERRLTVITFEVQAHAPCCLHIKIPAFNHRIYLRAGTHSINAPYHEGSLCELVEVEELGGVEKD